MATLGDIPTLTTASALAASDLVAVVDTSVKYAQIRKVPAALVAEGFTHAWVVNYDNATLAGDSAGAATVVLHSFTSGDIVTKARVIITKVFTASGMSALSLDLGESGDPDGYVDAISGAALGHEQSTGSVISGTATVSPSGTLDLTFTPSDVTTDQLEAGQVVVLLALTNVADYVDIVPAT